MSYGMISALRGSMVALITPFKDDVLDEEAFVGLCERQIERGTAALVPCGTTGEASTLTQNEQLRLIELAVKAARGRVPVIAGAGSNCTATAIELVRRAEKIGADAALCVAPYYNRPTQEGLFRHYQAIQAKTGLPILLYDVPARTGTGLATETVLRLADLPGIIGLKDASGDLSRVEIFRARLGEGFLRLAGNDGEAAASLSLGGHGCISVCANITPALCASLHRAWAENDFSRFLYLRELLEILAAAMFLETNPIPVKWSLARLGLCGDELRLPLTQLSGQHEGAVRHALDAVISHEMDEARRFAMPIRTAAE